MRHSPEWISRQRAKPRRAVPMCDLLADAPRSTDRTYYHSIRRFIARFARQPKTVCVGTGGFTVQVQP